MELFPTQSGSAGPAAHGAHAQAMDCDPACCGGDLWGENQRIREWPGNKREVPPQ